MTIQECYKELGGDFAQMQERLCSDTLIRRFIAKFPNDDSYSKLCRAVEEGRPEEAFRAAHTLKGVSANLSFTRLLTSVEKLTKLLRSASDTIPEGTALLLEEVSRDYTLTVTAIRSFLDSVDSCPPTAETPKDK